MNQVSDLLLFLNLMKFYFEMKFNLLLIVGFNFAHKVLLIVDRN